MMYQCIHCVLGGLAWYIGGCQDSVGGFYGAGSERSFIKITVGNPQEAFTTRGENKLKALRFPAKLRNIPTIGSSYSGSLLSVQVYSVGDSHGIVF